MIINGARSDYNAVMLSRGIHQVLDPYLNKLEERLKAAGVDVEPHPLIASMPAARIAGASRTLVSREIVMAQG